MSVATRLHGADGALIIERAQDCAPILDRNKTLANDGDGFSASRAMRRVASIPLVLIEKWANEEGIDFFNPDHADAIKRKLNDPDYLWLRTAPGRV
jgi:hypothetical protein